METRKSPSFVWLYVIAFVVDLAAVVGGCGLLRQTNPAPGVSLAGAALLIIGGLGIVVCLATLAISQLIDHARQSTLKHQEELVTFLNERLQSMSVLMTLISEQQLLSDRAKAVAFRAKDREVVERAVQEEIGKEDWEAAFRLANDIETGFGHKQEADRYRTEITSKRDEIQRRRVAELLAPVDRYIKAELWGAALQEARDIMAKYPSDSVVQKLPEEIESRRQMRKQQLRDSWQDSVNRHDVDGSIEILKKLDLYLTPAEAESMQEIARNVFREKRESLRARFALAVQEHKWAEAIKLGDELMTEFPNTRYAQEVRDMMATLKQRADQPQIQTA